MPHHPHPREQYCLVALFGDPDTYHRSVQNTKSQGEGAEVVVISPILDPRAHFDEVVQRLREGQHEVVEWLVAREFKILTLPEALGECGAPSGITDEMV